MEKIVARDKTIEVVHFCCQICDVMDGCWCRRWGQEIRKPETTYCDPGRARHADRCRSDNT